MAVGAPLANGFGTATNTTFQRYNTDQGDIKIDYVPAGKDHINARYSKMDEYDPGTSTQPLLGNSLSVDWINSGSVNWTHTFSPNLLNEVRFGKNGIKLIAPTVTFDSSVGNLANTIGIIDGNPAGIAGLPAFGFGGGTASSIAGGVLTGLGSGIVSQHFSSTITQFDDSLIYTHGRHTIRAGFSCNALTRTFSIPATPASWSGGLRTGTTGQRVHGRCVGDFALGLPESVGRGVSTGGWHARDWLFAGFVQDDWRVKDNLTVNLGLRYENRTPWTEVHNRQVNVNINTGALEFVGNYAVPNGIVGTNGASAGLYPATNGLLDFQPRIGFAWSPTGGKTIVRGGFSISSFMEGTGTKPASDAESALHAVPICWGQRSDRHGGIQHGNCLPVGSAPQGDPFINSTMLTWWNVKPAIADQYNLTIQREIARNTTVQVGYVGQRTTHLMVPIDLNQGICSRTGR